VFLRTRVADDLLATGQLDERNAGRFVATVHDAAHQGRHGPSMFAVAASAPT
jgi:hypothetical protein